MKTGKSAWLFVPFACMIGIIVGAWGPREELRHLKKTTENTASNAPSSADGFNSFANLVNIPKEAHSRHRTASDKPLFTGATNSVEHTAAVAADMDDVAENDISPDDDNAVTNAPAHRTRPERLDPADLRARIAEAQELWSTRVDIARAQCFANLGIQGDAEAEAKFDEAVNSMNDELYATMQNMAEIIRKQPKLTKELGVRMMNDVSGIIAETYESIGAFVPEDKKGDAADLDFTDFIDPAVIEPLVQVQDKLEDGMGIR